MAARRKNYRRPSTTHPSHRTTPIRQRHIPRPYTRQTTLTPVPVPSLSKMHSFLLPTRHLPHHRLSLSNTGRRIRHTTRTTPRPCRNPSPHRKPRSLQCKHTGAPSTACRPPTTHHTPRSPLRRHHPYPVRYHNKGRMPCSPPRLFTPAARCMTRDRHYPAGTAAVPKTVACPNTELTHLLGRQWLVVLTWTRVRVRPETTTRTWHSEELGLSIRSTRAKDHAQLREAKEPTCCAACQ